MTSLRYLFMAMMSLRTFNDINLGLLRNYYHWFSWTFQKTYKYYNILLNIATTSLWHLSSYRNDVTEKPWWHQISNKLLHCCIYKKNVECRIDVAEISRQCRRFLSVTVISRGSLDVIKHRTLVRLLQ